MPFRFNPQRCASVEIKAARCNFGAELDNYLRDHLIAGINDAALQKKMLLDERPTFSSLRTICEKFEELDKAAEQPAVLRHKCANGRNQYKQALKPCFSCCGSHLRANCKFRNFKCYNCHKLRHISKVFKKSATMLTDATDQNNSVLIDFHSIALCTDSDEHVFETCKSLSGQGYSFIVDTASRHVLITHADLLKLYPNAKLKPTKETVICANMQPLQFLDGTTIPIINGHGNAVHCEFLVQKRGVMLLGILAMPRLGKTSSFRKVKEEPKHSEPGPPSP